MTIDKTILKYGVKWVGVLLLALVVNSTTYAQESEDGKVESKTKSKESSATIPKNKNKADDKVKVKIGGRLMFDFDQFDGFYNEGRSGSDSGLRRGRLSVESSLKNRWSAVVEFSFDEEVDNVDVQEASFSYRGWKSAELVIGKSKEPFGLERSTSSKYISTIERSAATSAFAPSKNNGLALHSRNTKHHTWAIGLFENAETRNGVDTWAVTGRVTYAPLDKKRRLLHFGLSGTARDMGDSEYEVQQEVEVQFADELDYGPKVIAEGITRIGLESAWVQGPFSLQGEWFSQQLNVNDPTEDDDATYSGYYLLVSYFVTGESRRYKNGRFRRVKPANYGGALELVGRYSVLDAVDNNDGIKSETTTIGFNYYTGKQVRFMANYIETSLSGPDADEETSGKAFSLRAQYDF